MDHLGITQIANNLGDLIHRAKIKQLKAYELSGGTFSITNPGMYGCLHSQPIINQPQVAILSIGSINRRPCYVGDKIEPKSLCQIGLTFDHRVIDGKDAALFLRAFESGLQEITEKSM